MSRVSKILLFLSLLATSSAQARLRLQLDLTPFFDTWATTDQFGASGTLASALSYRGGLGIWIGSPTGVEIGIGGEVRQATYVAPSGVTVTPDKLTTKAGFLAFVKHLGAVDLALLGRYAETPVLVLTSQTDNELRTALLPEIAINPRIPFSRQGSARFSVHGGYGLLFKGDTGSSTQITGGHEIWAGALLELGQAQRFTFEGRYVLTWVDQDAGKVTAEQKGTGLFFGLQIRWP